MDELNRIEQDYYKEVGKFPVLTRKEEKSLLLKFHVEKDQKAFEMLVNSNLRFVLFVIKKYYANWLWAFADSKQDLVNEGNDGLIHAVKKYDVKNIDKVALNSYAVWWIRQRIDEYISSNFHLVRVPPNKFAEMMRMKSKLLNKSRQEVADDSGVTIEDMDKLDVTVTSINEDVAVNEQWFDNIEANIDRKKKIRSALELLKPREQEIIKLYFGVGVKQSGYCMTLEEIGKATNVSKEMIRTVKNRAIRKLRGILEVESHGKRK